MRNQIYFDTSSSEFRTRAFSDIPVQDMEAFRDFTVALSDYKLEHNGDVTAGLDNNKVEVMFDPMHKGVNLGVAKGSFADLSGLVGRFEPIRTRKLDRLGRSMSVTYRDYDVLANYFNKQIFGRDFVIFGPSRVHCADSFAALLDGFNSFQKGLKVNFADLKVIFPYATLIAPLSKIGRVAAFKMSFEDGAYKASAEVDGKPIMEGTYASGDRSKLVMDEGELQKVMRPTDYEVLVSGFLRLKKFGIPTLELSMAKPNSIYSSATTMFRHQRKSGALFNTM